MKRMLPVVALSGVVLVVGGVSGCVKDRPTLSQVPPPPDEVDPLGTYDTGPTPTVVTRDGGGGGGGDGGGGSAMVEYVPAPARQERQPAAMPKPAPEFDAEAGPRVYVVRKNDNLWDIAVSELGEGMRWVEIRDLNQNVDPENLPVGATLVLPEGKTPPRRAVRGAGGGGGGGEGGSLPPQKDGSRADPTPTPAAVPGVGGGEEGELPPLKDDRGPRGGDGGGAVTGGDEVEDLPPLPPVEPEEQIRMKVGSFVGQKRCRRPR